MSKNVWLERAEKKKSLAANSVKFKGKFQEAGKTNINKRIYPSFTKEQLEAGGKWQVSMECKATAEEVKKAVPEATVVVACCRDNIAVDAKLEKSISDIAAEGRVAEDWNYPAEVTDRWHAPVDDECGWIPIRPKDVAAVEAKSQDLAVSEPGQIRLKENDFIDLSAVKITSSRYKEYERLKKQLDVMEDAMIVYKIGRSEPKGPVGFCGSQGVAGEPGILADGVAGEPGILAEDRDVAYFRSKLFKALQMPSKISERDVEACFKMDRESGESPPKFQEKLKKLQELKLQVMAENPQIMGVPAPQFFNTPGPQGVSATISGPTALRFHPDQIVHMNIGEDRRVFSIDVKSENADFNAEKYIEKLKEEFRKKKIKNDPPAEQLKAEFTKRAMEKMEAPAAESETWFAPSFIGVFAEGAVEAYKTLTAKIDSAFLDTTTTPEQAAKLAGFTVHDPVMAENALKLDKLPACETFTVNGWNQPGVGQWEGC